MAKNEKTFSNSFTQLDESVLECVYGGIGREDVFGICVYTTLAGASATLCCSVAGMVSQFKAKNYRKQGNTVKAEKFQKAGRILTDVSLGTGAVGTAGVVGMVFFG